MRSGLTRGLTAAVLAPALVAAGCGSTDSTTSKSKAEFLKKGNAICKGANRQISQAAKKALPSRRPSQEQAAKFATDTVIPVVQREINGLKALRVPRGDEAEVKAIVAAGQTAVYEVKANPAAITSNNRNPFATWDAQAKAYGLTVCAS
jgi:hypothetical protein